MKTRWKIDTYESRAAIFGLFVERRYRGFFGWKCTWYLVDNFRTRDEAKALYQAIKDLPEYLN